MGDRLRDGAELVGPAGFVRAVAPELAAIFPMSAGSW
jgi:hypothetical protein